VYNNVASTLPVTSNDVNSAGGLLTLTIATAPAHGTATVVNGNISYQGNSAYTGPDTLTYRICDTCSGGNNCATAFVYLNVTSCQAVEAANDQLTVTQQDTASINILTNDGHAFGYGTPVVTILTAPHFGSTVTLVNGDSVVYKAGVTGFGIDSVLYQVCTNCGCDSAYLIVHVNQAPCRKPVAYADNEYAGYSSNCSNSYNVLSNDILPINGGTVTVTIVTQPLYGTATVVGNRVVYTCTDSTQRGNTDLVRYSVCNSCFCDTGIVAIHITNYPCNGLNPIINKDTAYVCRNYSVTMNVTANDTDPEGGIVSIDTIVGAPAHGTAVVINANDIIYTPAINYSGHDLLVYQACDNGTPRLCNIATVDVYVQACNVPPVIVNAAGGSTDTLHVSIPEDSNMIYCINYIQADSPYAYISSISASPDTVTSIAGIGTLGTTPACVYIAPPTNGRDEQAVQVIICNKYPLCDTVEVYITIIPTNHAPIANPDNIAYSWTGSGCSGVNVLSNDVDIDSADHLTITHFDSLTTHGGMITGTSDSTLCYTADSFYAGIDTFAYTICDLSGACSTTYVVVTVPVLARNDQATTQQDQPVSINIGTNDTKTANEYVVLCSMIPAHGTAVLDSSGVTYTPVHDYPVDPISGDTSSAMGLDSFCYTLCSVIAPGDTSCSTAEVYVSIAPKGKFYIPQGISPNGDGVNDKFVIVSDNEFPMSQLLVYNRYGDEVWRNDGNGYQNDFDGTWKKNGQPLPDSSYWYIFKFNDGVHADRMGYIIIER
jgi:gliding motility-associated-like protein